MDTDYPASWDGLSHPWTRRDLLTLLDELTIEEPCKLWAKQRSEGKVVGFDEAIHFFFDDHDFDAGDIGLSLFDENEVRLLNNLKEPLGTICDDLPDGNDFESVGHPLWGEVRKQA